METLEIKTDKEDFINEMLNQSDYHIGDIEEFATEHLQNLLTYEENVNLFIQWIENNINELID